jgi:hypothetical protein
MKDPIGLVVALLFLACGAYFYIQRGSFVNPDSANRETKLKKFQIIGGAIFISGVLLLVIRFFG